jgi:hypothetical protein
VTTHPADCTCDTYGCQLRRKGISLSASASPTARARRPFRPSVDASINKGLSGEVRSDGSFMPTLDGSGRKIRVKEGRERRREIEDFRRRRHQGPAL